MKRKYINPTIRIVQCHTQKFFATSANNDTNWQVGGNGTSEDDDPDKEDGSRVWNGGSIWDDV